MIKIFQTIFRDVSDASKDKYGLRELAVNIIVLIIAFVLAILLSKKM